jgi:NADH-quinone oxidoreductase subunit F
VLTTLRYFRDEYEAHVLEHRCPAKVCRPLIRYTVDADACTGCHVCFGACPVNAISGERKQAHVINQKLCTKCDTCRQVCTFDAIDVDTGVLAVAEGRAS